MLDRRSLIAGATASVAGLAAGSVTLRAQIGGAPIKVVFPFGAGGGGDALARTVAERLQMALGRSAIVENRTGADGRIGINGVKAAAPDGDTLLMTTGPTMWLMALVHKNPGFDPFKDFEPISHLASIGFCVAVANNIGVKSMAELVAWTKANPEKATYGIPGVGTIPHFIGVALAKQFGVDMRRLPYRGAAPAMTDLVAGQIPLAMSPIADALPQHRGGNVRILAVASKTRSPFLPEAPTLIESGYKIDGEAWYGLWAPVKTPAAVVERLSKAMQEAMADAAVKKKLETLGLEVTGTTPQRLVEIMRENTAQWAPIVKESGYTMDQ